MLAAKRSSINRYYVKFLCRMLPEQRRISVFCFIHPSEPNMTPIFESDQKRIRIRVMEIRPLKLTEVHCLVERQTAVGSDKWNETGRF